MHAATRPSRPGTIVSERLRSGSLSDGERNALRAVRDRSDADIGDGERVDERMRTCCRSGSSANVGHVRPAGLRDGSGNRGG